MTDQKRWTHAFPVLENSQSCIKDPKITADLECRASDGDGDSLVTRFPRIGYNTASWG